MTKKPTLYPAWKASKTNPFGTGPVEIVKDEEPVEWKSRNRIHTSLKSATQLTAEVFKKSLPIGCLLKSFDVEKSTGDIKTVIHIPGTIKNIKIDVTFKFDNDEMASKLNRSTPDGVEEQPKLDSLGLPWDKRINTCDKNCHSGRSFWKTRRGLSSYLVSTIRDELRRKQNAENNNNTIDDHTHGKFYKLGDSESDY